MAVAQPLNSMDCSALRLYLDKRLQALRNERSTWFGHWRDLSDNILPRRGKFLVTPNESQRGSIKTQRIIDNTATLSAGRLAAGIQSGVTSPARPWFRLALGDADLSDQSDVKLWLDEVQRRMFRVLGQSNIYNCTHVLYEEVGVFGNGVLLIEEDDLDVIRGTILTAGEYMLATNNRGRVDVLFREFVMTVEQMSERFGLENLSSAAQALYYTGQMDQQFMIAHAIEPNSTLSDGLPGVVGKKPYRSTYWEWANREKIVLECKGFNELPFMAFRWHVIANEPYGRSPGMDALGDVKALQKMQLRSQQAIDKMVNPPMVADIAMKNENASLLPGGVTYVSQSGAGFKPAYEISPNIQGIEQKIRETQERIKSCFFEDLWMMIAQLDTVRTATEIVARKEEKMLQLGPVLERMQFELLDPIVERVFSIMMRRGLLPPAPQSVQGNQIDVQYVSTLADAQKAVDTTGVERLVAFVGNIAAARPDALDNLNVDEIVDSYADMLGVSPKVLESTAQVAAIRAQRAKQAQQAQSAQNAMAAVQGAQTLSQTDVGGGQNALEKMGGGIG